MGHFAPLGFLEGRFASLGCAATMPARIDAILALTGERVHLTRNQQPRIGHWALANWLVALASNLLLTTTTGHLPGPWPWPEPHGGTLRSLWDYYGICHILRRTCQEAHQPGQQEVHQPGQPGQQQRGTLLLLQRGRQQEKPVPLLPPGDASWQMEQRPPRPPQ